VRTPSLEARAAVLSPVVALLVVFAVGNVLVLACGQSPLSVFGALLDGTWGNPYGVGQVLFKTTPLVLTGLAVAIPFRAGFFNIGAEGQAVLGALATAIVGAFLPPGTPWIVAVGGSVGAGLVVGAAWGGIPGLLRARTGAHEVITSIMLNFIAFALANWLVATWLAMPETLHTAPVVQTARLARFSSFWDVFEGSALNVSFLLALAVAGATSWLLFRTPLGFRLRAVGANPRAAEYGGVSLPHMATLSMALGGACAGLVGTNFVLGYKTYYEDGFSGGIGFMGIAVALLGRNRPLGVVGAALLFGTLSQGTLVINALVPKEIVEVLQALVILAVLASSSEVRARLSRDAPRKGDA